MSSKLVTIAQFREIVPLSRTSTYALINKGDLTTVRLNRRTLITMESVQSLIARSSSGIR